MCRLTVALGLVGSLLIGSPVSATPILELELAGTATNNTLATAEAIPGSAFTTPVPATVFNPPGYATATITGQGGGFDVDFFSFVVGSASGFYFDIDNAPFTFDTMLSLFNASGTLIALGDNSAPADPGSASALDAFVGTSGVLAAGTYFLAVSQFPNYPTSGLNVLGVNGFIRPDGAAGGFGIRHRRDARRLVVRRKWCRANPRPRLHPTHKSAEPQRGRPGAPRSGARDTAALRHGSRGRRSATVSAGTEAVTHHYDHAASAAGLDPDIALTFWYHPEHAR